MSGPAVARSVLVANSGVTNLVPAARIIADEVAPQSTALPFILVKHVSGVDRKPLTIGGTIHTRKRVQVEVHAESAPQRKAVKEAIRSAALSSPFPTFSGLSRVTLHTEGEGPDFTSDAPFFRIGEQDLIITYTEDV